ncbi:MAG: hydantoinase/oxoprolinase family protein [Candidatus Helarchaeota archaeon]
MVNIIGFDVGGVNIKSVFVKYVAKKLLNIKASSKYYPMWLKDPSELPTLIETIIQELSEGQEVEQIGITMTAEVSDAYYTKREGVIHILTSFSAVMPQITKKVISIYNKFLSIEEAMKDYMAIASANWIATALYIGRRFPNCIFIDIGSTTTDIIPIANGLPDTLGKTDLDRLLNGELVYTGSLRSTIPSIVHKVPVKGRLCPISFEKFALIADVHLLLDHISTEDYTCDTADGRNKTKKDALARLARIVCADIDMLSDDELYDIAKYIYERQLDQIREGLVQVLTTRAEYDVTTPIIVTGLGRDFLARRVAEQIGFQKIIDLEKELGVDGAVATPAAAIALLLAENYEES